MFYNYEFGFRKSHSTSHAIITLVERVSIALDMGKYVVCVFLDLKKAFDTVDHTIFLRKLEQYGIRGKHSDGLRVTYLIEVNMLNTITQNQIQKL